MTIYALGPFQLDTRGDLLLQGDEPVALGRRAVALLRVLIEQRGALVLKDALIEAAWPGQIVEDSNLTVQIAALRRVLGAVPGGDSWIETRPRRGYRFIGPVVAEGPADVTASASRTSAAPDPAPMPQDRATEAAAIADFGVALPDRPSLAVLPFQNMSGDPEQDYFVDGMVEEITTALSRIRWLFVASRNSSFVYKGPAIDVKRVGREIGVRYVLEGSVRKSGDRVRITAQLIDAVTDAHLWADRFDGTLEDVFDLQDKIASKVAGVIEPTLQAAETARSANRPTADLTAYDLYLRAYAMVWSSARQIPEAVRLMDQAIARDPNYGAALAWAAACIQRLVYDNRSEDPAADARKGAAYARRALEVARDDPVIIINAAVALAGFGEDIDAMMVMVDRALMLNPNFARGWHISGVLRNWSGQSDIAIAHAETALRLSPRARIGLSLLIIGSAHFFQRRFDEAETKLRLAIQEDTSFPEPYRFLAACYAHMGRIDDAKEIVERLRGISSVVIPDVTVLRDPGQRALYLQGVRMAAGEID